MATINQPVTNPQTFTSSPIINKSVPGGSNLTQSASQIVQSLLSGMPGTSQARNEAAFYGAGSGMPGSEFARNRGFDLYGQKGEERRQRGIQDLLAMISGTTGPTLQEQAQQQQDEQFKAEMAFRESQAKEARRVQNQQNTPNYTGLIGSTAYYPGGMVGNFQYSPAYSSYARAYGAPM